MQPRRRALNARGSKGHKLASGKASDLESGRQADEEERGVPVTGPDNGAPLFSCQTTTGLDGLPASARNCSAVTSW